MTEKLTDINSLTYKHFRVTLVNPTHPYDKHRNNAYYAYDYVENLAPGKRTTTFYDNNGAVTLEQFSDYFDLYPWYGRSSFADVRTSNKPSSHPRYSEIEGEALSKLIHFTQEAKVSSFNAAVSFAEADKVLHSISTMATRVFAFYKAVRKGDLGKAYRSLGISQHQSVLTERLLLDEYRRGITSKTKRIKPGERRYPRPKTVADNASSYFLETQYAWKPLLYDVKTACEKVATLVQDQRIPLIIRARANGVTDVSSQGYLTDPPETSSYFSQFNRDFLRVQYTLRYALTSEYLAQAASLGLTDPFSVVWETIPYSFIVDWFIPVGQYLSALSAFTGLAFESCVLSAVRKRESGYGHTGQPEKVSYGYGTFPNGDLRVYMTKKIVTAGCIGRYKGYSFTRVVLDDFPSPRLSLASKEMTWTKAAVVGALLQRGASNKRTHALSPLF